MEANPCIICYKIIPNYKHPDFRDPSNVNNPAVLARFFSLLGRHLDDGRLGGTCDGTGETMRFQFEKLTSSGMVSSCVDCSKIMESFCDLYHQMKSIELSLNWKVWTLNNIMQCGKRVPSRMKQFRERMKLHTPEDIIDLKEWLVTDCSRKLKSSFPRLEIRKCDSGEDPETFLSIFMQTKKGETSHPNTHDSDDDDHNSLDALDSNSEVVENVELYGSTSPHGSSHVDTDKDGDLSDNSQKLVHSTKGNQNKISRRGSDKRPQVPTSSFIKSEIDESSDLLAHGDYSVDRLETISDFENSLDIDLPLSPQYSHPDEEIGTTEAVPVKELNTTSSTVVREKITAMELPNPGVSEVDNNLDNTNRQQHDQQEAYDGSELEHQSDSKIIGQGYIPPVVVTPSDVPVELREPKCSINPKTKRLQCSLCPKEYRDKNGFQVHWRNIHLKIRYSCSLCKKQYTHQRHYDRHYRSTHMCGRLILCKYCDKRCISKSELIRHKKMMHSKAEPRFECQYCTKRFSQSSNASRHKKVCPAVNPNTTLRFECAICLEKFPSANERSRHQAVAHDGKKVMCKLCQQTFAFTAYKYAHKCPMRRPTNPDPVVG